MDELRKPANFNKLKAFFTELRSVGFNLRRVPGIFTVNRLQVRKEEALRLLRLLPEFQGEDFKNDDFLSQFLLKNQTKLVGLLDGLSPQQQAELRDLLLKPEMTTAEQASQPAMQGPAEAGAVSQPPLSGGSGGGMPSMPSVSAPAVHPIFRTKPPAAETPKPDIAIANSSGHVAEAGDPSKLVSTTSTGQIKEGGDASKLVSSGGGPLRETAHPKTGSEKTIPSGRRFNTSFFRSSAGNVFKGVQNFASPANPFLKTNLNRIGEGFKSMFGNLGNAGGRALLGGLNLGGNAGNRLSNFRSSLGGKMQGAGNRASSAMKGGGKKFALASGLGFLLFFLTAMSGNMTGTTPTGVAAPPAPVPAPVPGPITPPIPPTPCTGNDYKACLLANYKLDFQNGFPDSFLQMTYQALSSTDSIAPKFKNLLIKSCSTIKVVPTTTGVNYISGCTANLKSTIGSLTLIHELSHIIHNSNPAYYEGLIVQARTLDAGDWEGGYLTWYSKYASRPTDFSTICYKDSTGEDYLKDEEFAESVSYFIVNAVEMNMGSGCQAKWSDNPYQNGNRYKGHYNLISGILK